MKIYTYIYITILWHVRYTQPNNSAYAMHMHNMSHTYRPTDSTTKLIEYSKYRWKMKVDENLHTHLHNNTVISGQSRRSKYPRLWNYQQTANILRKRISTRMSQHALRTILPAQSVSNHSKKPYIPFCIRTRVTEYISKHADNHLRTSYTLYSKWVFKLKLHILPPLYKLPH
jgi:hypothetical protein